MKYQHIQAKKGNKRCGKVHLGIPKPPGYTLCGFFSRYGCDVVEVVDKPVTCKVCLKVEQAQSSEAARHD